MRPIIFRINITCLTHKCVTIATVLFMISYAVLSIMYINNNAKYIDIEVNNKTELENGNIVFDSQFGKLEIKKDYYNRISKKDSTNLRLNSLEIPDLLQNRNEKDYVIKEKLKLDDTYFFNSVSNTFTFLTILMLLSTFLQFVCLIASAETSGNYAKLYLSCLFLFLIAYVMYIIIFL